MTAAVAIVGIACRYPDARSPSELWQMALARRRAFRPIPAERLRLADYAPRDPNDADSIYPIEAALIEDYHFDRARFRVPIPTYKAVDLTHWLALEVASEALADAGFADGVGLALDDTGVVIGNTLTGEFSRAALMRYRWPYVQRVIKSVLAESNIDGSVAGELVTRIESAYKAPFSAPNEESLAGGLSNTIAGRICNHYGFRGGGFTIDGACASSLLAVISACSRLTDGEIDVAIAGAVDLSLDPFELVGFARNGALARDEMRVFDARSNGFWPGEGCGVVVLMRDADARAQGRRVYASIRGWGLSTDGQGGLTRPTCEGQVLALRRAYRAAGFGPETVAYFEAHGTGTAVGDRTELNAIASLRRNAGANFPAAVGSIKANIGHTKAAAGLAGLIKATLALQKRVIPPATGCERLHPALSEGDGLLIAPSNGIEWPREAPLRAGVSAMGFGGINTHVVLESEADRRRRGLDRRTRRLLATPQDTELFLFAADGREELQAQISTLIARAAGLSRAEMTDAAAALAARPGRGPWRAAALASSRAELEAALGEISAAITEGKASHLDLQSSTFFGRAQGRPNIVYLFPGQASPANFGGGLWRRRFDKVDELYRRTGLPESGDGRATELAQPAIVLASLAGLAILDRLGLRARAALGHSLGELTALAWAGAFDAAALLRVVRIRGQAMLEHALPGAMAALVARPAAVEPLLDGLSARIACHNGPHEQVVAGSTDAIDAIVARSRTAGVVARRLPVSHAFHSPLMEPAVRPFAAGLAGEQLAPPRRPLISSVTGKALDPRCDLHAHLCAQILQPVRFGDAAEALIEMADFIIEVGPGHVLSGLIAELTQKPIIPLDAGGPSLRGLLAAAATAFVLGSPVRTAPLFDRFFRPFNLERPRYFFANPCERVPQMPPLPADPPIVEARPAPAQPQEAPAAPSAGSALDTLRSAVADHLGLPAEAVAPHHRLLADLHLNSIVVGRLIVETARALGKSPPIAPTEFSNVTVAEAAAALANDPADHKASPPAESVPAGVDVWVRTFHSILEPHPVRLPGASRREEIHWELLSPDEYPLKTSFASTTVAPPVGSSELGLIVCLPPHPEPRHALLALQAARQAHSRPDCTRLLLVQHGGGGGALARSLSLEAPRLAVCVVDLPVDHPNAAELAVAEASAAPPGFTEVHYDSAGQRLVPGLEVLDDLPEPVTPFYLGPADVVLITGGGKGIGAEAALALVEGTGARLILVGRSPEDEPILAANLARMRANRVPVYYLSVNVADAVAVRTLLENVAAEHGPITAFLHAAGVNQPTPLATLDDRNFLDTLDTKWGGARNVLDALDPAQLRLFIGFGSIIARTGLEGEAHYGLANEWLTSLIEEYARAHRHCRCLAIEWSVWAGTGMGERLGVLDALAHRGIAALSIEDGLATLRRLVARPPFDPAVVVAGRFGMPPTVRFKEQPVPLLRYLETPRVHYPNIELVAESELSADTDLYLRDHTVADVRVLPGVLAIEAMTQAAAVLFDGDMPLMIEDLALREAIVVPKDESVTLRIAALRRSADSTEVGLRCSSTGHQTDHVRGVLGGTRTAPESWTDEGSAVALASLAAVGATSECLALDPASDLYGRLLFHTGRFRRLASYRWLTARECVADIAPAPEGTWFSAFLPGNLVLGDPGARDAAVHALQACIPHKRVLPVGAERIELGRLASDTPLLVVARERHRAKDQFLFDLELRDPNGSVVERWIGLQLRTFESQERPAAWPVPLAGAYLERRLSELLDVAVNVGLADINGRDGYNRSARRTAALTLADIGDGRLHVRPDGKPLLIGGNLERNISVAHASALTLAVTASTEIGCDIEQIKRRGRGWRDLLDEDRFVLAELLSERTGEDLDCSATRVWSICESLRKTRMCAGAPLLHTIGEEGGLELRAGNYRIMSFVETIGRGADRFAIAVSCGASPGGAASRSVGRRR
jgi:enediyne polyketide synthase